MMKNRWLCFLLAIFMILGLMPMSARAADGITIDEVNFPDVNFRTYVRNSFEKDGDNSLSASELEAAKTINVRGYGIKTMKGLEYFTSLTKLDCSDNQLTSLKVSDNRLLRELSCTGNAITISIGADRLFDLTALPYSFSPTNITQWTGGQMYRGNYVQVNDGSSKVTYNYDCGNGFSATFTMNVKDTSLPTYTVTFHAVNGSGTTEMLTDVAGTYTLPICWFTPPAGKQFKGWSFSENGNLITDKTIEVTGNISLYALWKDADIPGIAISEGNFPDIYFKEYIIRNCDTNRDAKLNDSEIAAITSMIIPDMGIYNLKGIEYFTALTELQCPDNIIDALDVSKNQALTYLNCSGNPITNLDLSKNTALEWLDCVECSLTELNITQNTNLTNLDCTLNRLTALDVSRNAKLEALFCGGNPIAKLDLSRNDALAELDVSMTELTELDVSHNTELALMGCSLTRLTSLDLTNNKKLEAVECVSNAYPITIGSDRTFNLTVLPGSFDVTRTSGWKGGTVTGNLLTVDVGAAAVSYTYACGNGQEVQFALEIKGGDSITYTVCFDANGGSGTMSPVTGVNGMYTLPACSFTPPAYKKFMGWAAAPDGDIIPSLTYHVAEDTTLYVIWKDDPAYAPYYPITVTDGTASIGYLPADKAQEGQSVYIAADEAPEDMRFKQWQVVRGGAVPDNPYDRDTWFIMPGNAVEIKAVYETVKFQSPVISVSGDTVSGKNVISWGAVSGAEEYKVYRATSKTGSYKRIATVDELSYTDSSGKPGTTYYYKIKAGNAQGKTSAYSNIKYRTCDLAQPDVKLSTVSATGKIKISWGKIADAKEYEVYRAASADGNYSLIKTTTGTSLTNTSVTAGKTYYYKVRAIASKSAANSAFSEILSRICRLARPDVDITSVSSSGRTKLTWNAVSGAEAYIVSRSKEKSGFYEEQDRVETTSFTDLTAAAGVTYYYKVKAVHQDPDGNSANSSVVYRTCDLARPEVTVSNIPSSGKIKISWEEVDCASEYKVYRATSKSGKYTLLKTTTKTSLTNTSVTAGRTYYYKVRAISDNDSANSAYSSVKSRTCDLAQPELTVSLTSSDKPRLTWSTVKEAEKYKVYRSLTGEGDSWILLKTTTGTSLTNTSVEAGRTYHYKVRAIHDNSSAHSAYSAVQTITLP